MEFIWHDRAKFKHLTTQDAADQAVLSSFGVAAGRMLVHATPPGRGLGGLDAAELRNSILDKHPYVDLARLLATCWAVGVPVVQLRVFPLSAKSMHAMVVESDGRHAILIGREASYPAPTAFTLAHEIGHAALGHLEASSALVDLEDPALAKDRDQQEAEADRFALTLLTGDPDPKIVTELTHYNAPTLAQAALTAGPDYGIEPGTLALCVAYRQRNWPVAMSALRLIYSSPRPVWKDVNGVAGTMLDWDAVSEDTGDFIGNLLSLSDV